MERDKSQEMFIDHFYSELQDYFVAMVLEIDGTPVTKDNVEVLFEKWINERTFEQLKDIVRDYVN